MNKPEKLLPDQAFRRSTMSDVADAVGVSVSTVSHVLNGTRFVSEDTSRKVQQAIRRLKFKTNPIARNLRSGRSRLIGIVINNIEKYLFVNVLRGIEKTANSLGYQLSLMDSAEQKNMEIKNVESLYLRGADGLIIAPTSYNCDYIKDLLPPNFPLVFVDRQPEKCIYDCVLLDNTEASYQATKHLLSRGYRKIGLISFNYHPTGKATGKDKTMLERVAGYKQALTEANIKVNPQLIGLAHGSSLVTSQLRNAETYTIMKHFLDLSVEAVLCGSSMAAIGAYTCLKDMAVKIPEDMGFISFDDDIWLSMISPQITVMAQPGEAMGAVAAARLFDRINGKELNQESLRLKAKLLLRESC
ncbi:LacI family transcriptional regulator [Treponema primitia]|uniref:LacI family DNA-binding transcriptional regulator n=1 Tax=Treponema primitia TaxID=88058 RepID=UPI00397F7A9D